MKKKLYVLALTIFSLFGLSAFIIEDDPFAALLKRLEEYTKSYPTEKVYLHLDKPYYAVGDDIWFKAYVIDSKTNYPSTLSNILYVELINEKDSVTKQIKLPMQSGITWGDFKLADTLNEGSYRLRAYTQWMRNAGPEFFFDKTINIGNSWSNKVFTKTSNILSIEGNGQKMASTIKFTNKDGKPFANHEVSYEIILNDRIISKSKGITNSSGEILINVINPQPNIYKSGKIVATITMADKQKIVKQIPIKTTSTDVDVQFFPEGGSIIEGLPCKIAIKAVNNIGLGENVSGKVIDNDGLEISSFSTTYLGMGSLFLNALPGKSYSAKVKFANGSEKLIPLPKTETSGYQLTVNNLDTAKMGIKVMLTPDFMNKGELSLVAQHNGTVYFVTKIPTTKQITTISAAKNEFASGIVQLTLFSAANIPVSERLVFINNTEDKIELNISNLNANYAKRGKVELNINAINNSKPVQGSFSISVTNTAAVTPDLDNESNILTRLLLTSELAGYIEKPNHYFLSNDVKTRTELDNLMLTQGWRKIDWKKVINTQPTAIVYQAEKTMKISGKITKGGKPVPNGKVMLFSSSGGFFATDTLSDANGNFNFDQIAFADSTKFVVQARTSKDNKNVKIDLDITPRQIVTKNKNTGDIEINVNDNLLNYLKQSDLYFDEQYKRGFLNRTITLKEVNVVAKKNPAINSSNLNGAGRADAIITAKDLETTFSLSQYLSGRIAGITVRGGKAYSTRGTGGPMSVVLDGMNLGSDMELDELNVQDIETVEVLKSIGNTAIYGMGGGNGVLVITTKRGAGTENNYVRYSPGIVTYAPKGYHTDRQFYSPKYDVMPDNKPDFRTTVYWNPHFVTDASGKSTLSYFNTDQPGIYRIVIEGIDVAGYLARKTFTYQVN